MSSDERTKAVSDRYLPSTVLKNALLDVDRLKDKILVALQSVEEYERSKRDKEQG